MVNKNPDGVSLKRWEGVRLPDAVKIHPVRVGCEDHYGIVELFPICK